MELGDEASRLLGALIVTKLYLVAMSRVDTPEPNRRDFVMDVQMPEMDGFAATAAIREQEAARPGGGRLLIVALTAFAMKGDRERCLAAGMDDYLAKPIRPDQLVAVLTRLAREAPDRLTR